MKQIKQRQNASRWIRVLLPVALVLAGALPFIAQVLHQTIEKPHADALRSVAKLMTGTPDRIDTMLEKVGFPAPSAPQEWHNYPVVRKLEFAYVAAENAKLGNGGRMLALLAHDLKAHYDSVAYESSLQSLLLHPASGRVDFQMTDIPPPSKFTLTPVRQRAIATISHYTEGGAIGGPQTVLEYHFNLPPQTTYDILRRSNTTAEAITLGLSYVPEQERDPALRKVVQHIERAYPQAAIHEKSLAMFREDIPLAEMPKPFPGPEPVVTNRDPNPPPSSSFGGGGGGVGGGGGASSEARTSYRTASERYVRFTETRYPVSSGRTFSRMIRFRAGFGGVVFGNQVKSARGLPKAAQLIWIPRITGNDKATIGEIRVRFINGSESIYGPVEAEDVYAGLQILQGRSGSGGFPAYFAGDGMGLVSLEGQDSRPRLTEQNKIVWDARWDITIHPALARLRLGRSIIMCDAIPINRESFIQLIEANRGKSSADHVRQVLSDDLTNWKIVDAPLEITSRGNRIEMLRAESSQLSSDYRRQVFLSMQGFRQNSRTADVDFPAQFAGIAFDIVQASEHYKRLNNFAAVFAFLRWAKGQNAKLVNPPGEPDLLDPVPPSLMLMDDNRFELAGYAGEADVLREFYKMIEDHLPAITRTLPPELRPVVEKSAQARQQIESDQVRLAELEQELEELRLDFRAISLRLEEMIPLSQEDRRSELLDLEDAVERQIRGSSRQGASAGTGSGNASSQLITFAASISRELANQLNPLLEKYIRVTAQFQKAEFAADQAQLQLHSAVHSALLGEDGHSYDSNLADARRSYTESSERLVKLAGAETAERNRLGEELSSGQFSIELMTKIMLAHQQLDALRGRVLNRRVADDQAQFAKSESDLSSAITQAGVKSTGFIKAVQTTDQAILNYAAALRTLSGVLESRDAYLDKKFPDWRSWWTVLTCSRHQSPDHLDFDTVAAN